ncbi:hypothetical protein VNO77_15920 [Canavalia gladiata]|uniref:Uncharacterized protein n=1 Tax=Canavalia gladiata TaxID=3824 RepID=A0AAN9QW44_CANGL
MSSTNSNTVQPKPRTVGGTECSWCKAVLGGTGIAILALLTSKPPHIPKLQTALNKLQTSHPILRSRLHHDPNTATFSFSTFPTPFIKIVSHTLSSTEDPLQYILQLELNHNTWHDLGHSDTDDVFFASVYAIPEDSKWVVVMRLHVSVCDRTTAVSLLRELVVLMEESGCDASAENNKQEASLPIEDLMPRGKAKKAVWARGFDMLSYSFNSLRLTNLKFVDTKSARFSQVVRLQLNHNDTNGLLAGCKWSGIKLCGALVAAGLMAAHCSKRSSKKYGVVTLTDCRSTLESSLSDNFGFYHSAIVNCYEMKGEERVWELAKRSYEAFESSKKGNKHFSDMADLNFLMCKAIENPSLTPSSSLRTSIMSVFEDTVIDNGGKKQREIGVEDYMGCASVHGVGPSIAIFDTIRDGCLDCVCVYPSPLHSKEQIQELVRKMKGILIEASNTYKQ